MRNHSPFWCKHLADVDAALAAMATVEAHLHRIHLSVFPMKQHPSSWEGANKSYGTSI